MPAEAAAALIEHNVSLDNMYMVGSSESGEEVGRSRNGGLDRPRDDLFSLQEKGLPAGADSPSVYLRPRVSRPWLT